LQLNNNNVSEEEKGGETNKINVSDNDGFKSIIEKFFSQLIELNNITAFGPLISLMNDPNINLKALQEHGNLLMRYQSSLNYYLSSMINGYSTALNKISSTATKEKTPDAFRKIIINSFEDAFTSMFESPEFSITYNNLANSLIDLTKSYQRFFESSPLSFKQSQQQQFSKEEKDLLFYNLYEIKKLSMEIKKKLNEEKNE